jgi:hypothetical protein
MTGKLLRTLMVQLFAVLVGVLILNAAETQVLKAKVADIDGRPMQGAKVFLYDSSNVRRPADFISTLSDRSGVLQIALPPGKYWGVARFKADGKYGPLLPGDKHSGEPLEIDLTTSDANSDFVVADIRELGQKKHAGATDAIRLKGRIIDIQGKPLANAYVYANTGREFSELPDYLSAWTGEDGHYELFVPPGDKYYVGASLQFPMKIRVIPYNSRVVEPGKIDIAIDMNLTVE